MAVPIDDPAPPALMWFTQTVIGDQCGAFLTHQVTASMAMRAAGSGGKKIDLVINIPKDHTTREITNGYTIRRSAIDYSIPLITNARVASAFIYAFCKYGMEDLTIKSWDEYKD